MYFIANCEGCSPIDAVCFERVKRGETRAHGGENSMAAVFWEGYGK